MECLAGAVCQVDVNGGVRCACDITCPTPKSTDAVCGSDLQLYESECHMMQQACLLQVLLYVTAMSECVGEHPYLVIGWLSC